MPNPVEHKLGDLVLSSMHELGSICKIKDQRGERYYFIDWYFRDENMKSTRIKMGYEESSIVRMKERLKNVCES